MFVDFFKSAGISGLMTILFSLFTDELIHWFWVVFSSLSATVISFFASRLLKKYFPEKKHHKDHEQSN